MKIYIACALTHVPRGTIFEEHIAFIHGLAETLKNAGHDVMYALVNSDPQLASKPFEERARLCYSWVAFSFRARRLACVFLLTMNLFFLVLAQ
jgi:hypothetical protein